MAGGDQRATAGTDPFRELFDRVPIGLYRTTPGGRIVDANPMLCRMLGYPSKDALIAQRADAIYATAQTRRRWVEEMEAKGTVSGFEAQWRRHDGSCIWVEENAYAVRDADGTIVHYEGCAVDATERRRARAALAEEKARFEQLFAAAPEAIVLCDNTARILRVNDEFERLFGYSAKETLGRNIDELVAKGLNGLHDEASGVTRTIARGETASIETRRRHKDGHLIDVSILGKPVLIDGKKVALYAIYRNITARVEMEAKLAEEKARFEQLFAVAPEAIVLCANDGSVLRANDEFFRMFGYTPEEVLGRDIDRLVAPESDALRDEARGITQRIAQGERSSVETRRRRKDGQVLHVSILGKPILIAGNQIAVYGIYRDITARKEAEEALATTHRKVEELHGAADALDSAADEEDVYRITCDAAERVLGFSLGMLCIRHGEEFACRAVSSRIAVDGLERTRIDPAGIALRALASGQPVIVEDAAMEDLPQGIPPTARSLICAPIGDLGIFQAASPEPGAFNEEDGRLLAILLGHTAIGVARFRLQEELVRQARHDALTGVYNRHHFHELITREVLRASRHGHPIGLLMIDVDRFKEINDRYGHQTGDRVLREIATVLRETVRRTDLIVRYGGDEFLIVLTETGEDTEEAADRVRRAVQAHEAFREISDFHVTVSVGSIFWSPEAGTSIEEALAAADSRMYEDKRRR